MGFIDILKNPWFTRLVLAAWLFSSVLLLFFLNFIDSIVHGQLYNYGLEFNIAWADPYWNALHLIYVLLAVPAVFSAVALIVSFAKSGNYQVIRRATGKSDGRPQKTNKRSLLARCERCGKLFKKPETKFHLKNGKLQAKNVCPHCQLILGKTEKRPDENISVDFQKEETVVE